MALGTRTCVCSFSPKLPRIPASTLDYTIMQMRKTFLTVKRAIANKNNIRRRSKVLQSDAFKDLNRWGVGEGGPHVGC